MKKYLKRDYPVQHVRRILEPGPITLVSSAWKGRRNVMTMGWHSVMEFSPSLLGCVISNGNASFELIRKSKSCVINIPTAAMADVVTGIGNCSLDDVGDKFELFGLTAASASKVGAPLIRECFASFECRLHDARLVKDYNFFIFEVVKAHVTPQKRLPQTLHYHGQGIFTTDGKRLDKSRDFTKWKKTATF